jgi:hypothetical protein
VAWPGAQTHPRRRDGSPCGAATPGVFAEPDEGDWPAVADTSDAAWQATLASLDAMHHKLCDAIRDFNPERLHRRLAQGKESANYAICGVIQHTLYHAGQIVLLKKA